MIGALLAKPFKMPKLNYKSELCVYIYRVRRKATCIRCPGSSHLSRGLGMRRSSMRTALHDAFEEGALVLHSPRHLSAHEQLTVDR